MQCMVAMVMFPLSLEWSRKRQRPGGEEVGSCKKKKEFVMADKQKDRDDSDIVRDV